VSPAPLVGISPDATPEEVAAVIAAFAVLEAERAVIVDDEPETVSNWVRSSRLTARRAGMQRGDYRLSGRIGRRARA
jgi:hypothetical protein